VNRLDGKVALVTGAGRGIGLSIAQLFEREGAQVVALDIVFPIEKPEGNARRRLLDIGSEAMWADVVAETESDFGGIDVLVNNANIDTPESILDQRLDDWNRVLGVSLTGTMLGLRDVGRVMKRTGGGSIINVASIYSNVAVPYLASYHAVKGGVRSLTKHAALTLAPFGVRVNSLHPGFVTTPATQAFPSHVVDSAVAATPLGRAADATEIAYGALFLACDESSFMTGSELVIDGGSLSQR
jgi:NAD(P)-dependent dehydrogenase (short-subunit alcohol dehydrogenase family)